MSTVCPNPCAAREAAQAGCRIRGAAQVRFVLAYDEVWCVKAVGRKDSELRHDPPGRRSTWTEATEIESSNS